MSAKHLNLVTLVITKTLRSGFYCFSFSVAEETEAMRTRARPDRACLISQALIVVQYTHTHTHTHTHTGSSTMVRHTHTHTLAHLLWSASLNTAKNIANKKLIKCLDF